jgi:sec-independent protein translocase protein TatB
MNFGFFGVGAFELALVVILAVIILGPDRIPELAVQAARAIRFLRGYATDATAQMRKELDELTRDYEDVRKELQEFRQSVQKDTTSITDEITKIVNEAVVEPGGEPPPDGGNSASRTNGTDARPKK